MKHFILRQLNPKYWFWALLPFFVILAIGLFLVLFRGYYDKEVLQISCVDEDDTIDSIANDSNVVVIDDNANCSKGIDMVFILDRTSSMGNGINNLRGSIEYYANKVKEVSNGKYRFGLISVHGDSDVPQYTLRLALAPSNENDLSDALLTFGPSGGGGSPEPTDNALEAILENTIAYGPFLDSRNKIIVVITDATPSGGDDAYVPGIDDVRADALAKKARSQNIRIFALNTGEGVVNESVVSIMKNYAFTTYGQYAESWSGEVASEIIRALDELCVRD